MNPEDTTTFPNSHELAGYFLQDTKDNLDRLHYWYFNYDTLAHTRKSKRTKAANDLLIAFECLVKGIVVFHKFSDLNGQILYEKLKNSGIN